MKADADNSHGRDTTELGRPGMPQLHYPVHCLSTQGFKTCYVLSGSRPQKPRQVSIVHMKRIRSRMHVLVHRNVYVHCSTILTIFYPVFKAAKALIDLNQSRAKEG